MARQPIKFNGNPLKFNGYPLIHGISDMDASGGVVTYDGNYKIHTFIASDNHHTLNTTFKVLARPSEVEYLVVGGGGCGGVQNAGNGGGGGAGGVVHGYITLEVSTYTVFVGNGGISVGPPDGPRTPLNGETSRFFTIEASGGGHGGYYDAVAPGNGASGGGSGQDGTSPGLGIAGQGHNGGGTTFSIGGHGGGGAGEAGKNGNTAGGFGGNGLQFDISGTPKYYGGGGAGSSHSSSSTLPLGGLGGGGNGHVGANAATDGSVGTGGGGGGGGESGREGDGGGGIVIIRYIYEVGPR